MLERCSWRGRILDTVAPANDETATAGSVWGAVRGANAREVWLGARILLLPASDETAAAGPVWVPVRGANAREV